MEYRVKDVYEILDRLMSDGYGDCDLDILVKDNTAFEDNSFARYNISNWDCESDGTINLYCE